jgi:proteasome lid subunit RPN8/RPN11
MNIVPKGSIEPVAIDKETNESHVLFHERSNLHESINGFKVYINQYAWDAFINHSNNVYKQTKHEAQGIFLGKYFIDKFGEFAVVTDYSEGKGESSHAYVGMSEECVAGISKKCSAENLLMLIWIHTHPNFGVFYSGTDVNCLRTNFFMPFQSGIVVDIIRRESKGFKVEKGNVNEFTGYYIYHSAEKRLSKPYAISVEAKQVEVKKNQSQKGSEFPTQEFVQETQYHILKKELSELKDLIANKILEKSTLQKEYFEEHFVNINQHLDKQKDYSEYFENLVLFQDKFRKVFLIFVLGLLVLFVLGAASFIYFVIKLTIVL